MTARTSGLERDISLIRRRWWLFIPFLVLGVLVTLAFGSFAGTSNAVASIQLETVVYNVIPGGDRGFRIFEADSMTRDEEFKKRVREAIGDPNFDYSRYTISLNSVAVADGVSQGTLTVSIHDEDLAIAERLRKAWVDTFVREYEAQDGLFRERFIQKKQDVLTVSQKLYADELAKLQALVAGKNLPIDVLTMYAQYARGSGLIDELSREEAQLVGRQAQVQGAIDSLNGANAATAAAVASAVLGKPVPAGEGLNALTATNTSLKAAITALRTQRSGYTDSGMPAEVSAQVTLVRSLDNQKQQASDAVEGARAAAASAASTADTTYSTSGGLAGSMVGRVAIVIAITVVFGLIAIYGVEWLSQIRANTAD